MTAQPDKLLTDLGVAAASLDAVTHYSQHLALINAADEIKRLRAGLDEVAHLHRRGGVADRFCRHCEYTWPCPTTKAVACTETPAP